MNEFLVIDYDETFTDIKPTVYLVDKRKIQLAIGLVRNAIDEWHRRDDDICIGDLIEEKWKLFHIWFHRVGNIHLSYENRQKEYLSENIAKVVI